jgi:hypothetical protein
MQTLHTAIHSCAYLYMAATFFSGFIASADEPISTTESQASHIDTFQGKPRVFVLTDIGNEPDDQMSLTRFLLYSNEFDQEVGFQAPATPGLVRLRATVRQRDVTCSAEALITVTDSLVPSTGSGVIDARGLPGYTFECASGELWRSHFDATRNVIVVNNGHRDFVFASRTQALKLRYLVRLYVKELVLRNFSGVSGDHLLERMIELSLYTEDKL